MTVVLYVFWLVVTLGVLVFIHELGHFLAAKALGVRVEVFSLGFGPRLAGFRRGDTDYRVSALPLGGYVRMTGELSEIPHREEGAPEPPADLPPDPASFPAKPRWARFVILCAGPAMNVALALVLWWGLYMRGAEVVDIPKGPPEVEAVEPDTPGARAGLLPGDAILRVGAHAVTSVEDYEEQVLFSPGKTLPYEISRKGQKLTVDVTIATHPVHGVGMDGVRWRLPILIAVVAPGRPAERAGFKAGDRILLINGRVPSGIDSVSKIIAELKGQSIVFELLRGEQKLELPVVPEPGDGGRPQIGVQVSFPMRTVRYGPVDAAVEAVNQAVRNTTLLFTTLEKLVTRQVGFAVMSGPLEIAAASKEQASRGTIPFLLFLAFISFQLGIFNLLPIPVLDGGHLMILSVEGAMRRDFSLRVKERVLQAGFMMLVVFAVAVIAMDVRKAYQRAAPPAPAKATAPATPAPAPAAAPAK